jgi:lipopolysaccharide transport system ATP-binding protein
MCSEVLTSMHNKNTVIHAHRLEKRYRLYATPADRLIASIGPGQRQPPEEVVALRPLSFQIHKGETVGIVGRNGSGKSTLLQLICGTLQPSGGSVDVRGRIGALLELGSGFNPEFTGIENIFLNGAILGLSQQEINQRLEAILSFADIGNFVERPVRTYSSGMALRLAFAVQACIDPEILVIDEALAVGDETFQKKCFNRLSELKEKGTSILFVTHSCPSIVQHCDRALLLDRGSARWFGSPEVTTTLYQRLTSSREKSWSPAHIELGLKLTQARRKEARSAGSSQSTAVRSENHAEPAASEPQQPFLDLQLKPETTQHYPDRGVRIETIRILGPDGEAANTLPLHTPFSLEFNYFSEQAFEHIRFACHIANAQGMRVAGQVFPSIHSYLPAIEAEQSFSIAFRFLGGLQPGLYFVGGGVRLRNEETFLHRVIDLKALRILESSLRHSFGVCDLSADPPQCSLTSPQP